MPERHTPGREPLERQSQEPQTPEHQTREHPTPEHPTPQHPTPEHQTPEHPTLQHPTPEQQPSDSEESVRSASERVKSEPLTASPKSGLARLTRTRLKVGRVFVWVIALPFVLWALARVARLDGFSPMAQLMAFTPYVAAASVVPLVLALLGRRWLVAALATATCATFAVCVVPRAVGGSSTMDGVPVTVMSVNMWEGRADAKAIVQLVRRERVDVLALQEFTPDGERRLADEGLEELLPYHVSLPVESTPGSGLYSRYPLTDTAVTMNHGGFNQARGVLQVPGGHPVAVESAHPVPPAVPVYVPSWRRDLREQPPAPPSGTPLILIGDFNATLDHSDLRRLIATGYSDAADAVGKGFTPTWPYAGPRSTVTPKVTIDHVFVDGRIGVVDFDAVTVANTDHRVIFARLILPAA